MTSLVEFYKSRGDGYKKRLARMERANKELLGEREVLARNYDDLNGENKMLSGKVIDLNEAKRDLKKVLEEKMRVIEEITGEKIDLEKAIWNLKDDFENRRGHYEDEISGKCLRGVQKFTFTLCYRTVAI